MYRTFNFDGDFRKQPKTKLFCCICQKDIKCVKDVGFVFLGEEFCTLVHPEDLNGAEFKVYVGSECARKIPKEFIT